MSLLLLVLFLLTLGYLGYFALPGSRRSDAFHLGRAVTTGYLLVSSLLIGLLFVSYTGFPSSAVRKLVRHIEFRGVAVTVPSVTGDTSNIRITGDPIDSESPIKRAFQWFALPSGAWIDLRPDRTDGQTVLSYRAEAHSCSEIVRLNRYCVNKTVGGWINVGEAAQFEISTPFRKGAGPRKQPPRVIDLKLSAAEDEIHLSSTLEGSAVKMTGLQDHLSLRDLLKATDSGNLRDKLKGFDNGLGTSILDCVQIIRRRRGDGRSEIGLVYRALSQPPKSTDDSDDSYYSLATIRCDSISTPSSQGIEAVDGHFRLDIFGSESRNAIMLPTTVASTVGGHAQLRFLFDPPRAYPLPPAELLKAHGNTVQLASADMGQDGSGYLFDTGNLNEGFLATAKLSDDGTSMGIANNVSDAASPIRPNEDQLLGSGAVAPIFALADPLNGPGLPWLMPAAGLLLGLFLCVSSFARLPMGLSGRRRQIPVNIAPVHAAFVVWVVSTAILAVRVVLAFRVSVLPPFNMDTVSAASFRGSWSKAWIPALILPPFIGILTLAVVRAKQPAAQQPWTERIGDWTAQKLKKVSNRPWYFLSRATYCSAFTLGFLMLLQKVIHFPFPDVVLVGVLLVILGLVFDGVGEARDDEFAEKSESNDTAQTRLGKLAGRFRWTKRVVAKKNLWNRNPLLWGAAFILFFLDPGTFLFFVPLVFALCVGGLISTFGQNPATADERLMTKGARVRIVIFGALALALLGIFISAPLGVRLLTNPFAAKVLKNAAFPYRLAATNSSLAEQLLVDPHSSQGAFAPHRMQETLHQRWEMIDYQQANGAGYFAAPLSNVGMTYPTTLSDAAFSVYLIGEHGKLAGSMIIGLVVLMALAIFRTAWLAACSRNQKANARGLYAIAGVFGCTAVYMALANLWVIPFTGQNVPLLSLNSIKDLLLNGTLLTAAILLIAFPGSWSSQADPLSRRDAKNSAIAWWAFPALLATGWFVLSIELANITGHPEQPFNLSDSTLTTIQQTVDEARAQAREQQLPLEKTSAIKGASPFVRELVASFDSGEVTKTPIVQGRGAASSIMVDKRFFLLRSPFEHELGVPWHGSLLATGKIRRHQLVVGGSRVPILMEEGMGPSELILGQPVKTVVAQTIDIKQLADTKGSGKTIDYGGIKLDGDRITLRWKDFGKPGTILINGKRLDSRLNEIQINESDIVSLEYTGSDGIPMKLSIHYLGATENKLASVVWRNGRYARTFPQGADLPLAYTIGEIGDEVARTAKKQPGDVQLSVDMQLQRDLQSELRRWAREKGRLIDRGATMPDGLPFTALSVLDSASGQIRALASLPQCDPREDFGQIEDLFSTESDAQVAARSSWTLVNRTIGSTIKPLGFSALNSQLDSKTFDLTQLHVNEVAGIEEYTNKDGESKRAYRQLGDIHLKQGKGLGSKENPREDVDMFTYLKDSRTWPAIVTSTIGLVSDKSHPNTMHEELEKMLSHSSTGPVAIGSQRMAFTPARALKRVFPNETTLSSVELADTAYFKGIEECYGPSVVPFNTNEISRWDDGLEKRFLAPFDLSATSKLTLKNLGLPEVHWADTTSLTDLDGQLIRYMIGGGECRWNAVTMATNFARITMGKKVQPTLSMTAKPIKIDMPAPINSFSWRKAHLLDPLFQITTIPADDVATIRTTVADGGYRIAMKTGTIDDGMGDQAMESEMLMFTMGRFSDSSGFVPGHCVSGFFSIRSSKQAEGDVMVKGDLIKRIMPILVNYLKRLEAMPPK